METKKVDIETYRIMCRNFYGEIQHDMPKFLRVRNSNDLTICAIAVSNMFMSNAITKEMTDKLLEKILSDTTCHSLEWNGNYYQIATYLYSKLSEKINEIGLKDCIEKWGQ